MSKKILNAPAGSIVIRRPDIVMSHDNSARIRKIFEEMGGEKLKDAGKLLVVLDRKMTGTTDELIRDYNSIHRFMDGQGCAGRKICSDKLGPGKNVNGNAGTDIKNAGYGI